MKRNTIYDHKARQIGPIKWHIESHENYGFAANKRCYNLNIGIEVKKVVNAAIQGATI